MPIRPLRSAIVVFAAALAARSALADVAAADGAFAKLLLKYVTPAGVRYEAWRSTGEDLKRLSEVLMAYRSEDLQALAPAAREALLVNLYNGLVLEIVLQARPFESIRDLSRGLNRDEIFSRKVVTLGGKGASLNDLEARLRDEFNDPRIHFAISCASRSCSPLRAEPYLASSLDEQLDDAVRTALARPGFAAVARRGGKTTLVVSKIFEWHAKDFAAGGGVQGFLAKYGTKDVADAAAGGRVKIAYAAYDWRINAVR